MLARPAVLIAFIYLFPLWVCAQRTISLLSTPLKYDTAPDGDIIKDTKTKRTKSFWIVCADRDNCQAYKTADASSPLKVNICFMDKFYVTGETKEFLEVYKWEEGIRLANNVKRDELNPQKAQRIGWVKKEQLLLWNRCIEDKKTHLPAKVLFALTEKNIVYAVSSGHKNPTSVYTQPDLLEGNGYVPANYQLLYCYKRSGTSVLVGRVDRSNPFKISKDILGWVDETMIQKWDVPFFIEPNAHSEAVAERMSQEIRASVFADKKDASAWKESSKDRACPIWDNDLFYRRLKSSDFRFPVLYQDNDFIQTGFFTKLFNTKDGKPDKDVIDYLELHGIKISDSILTLKKRLEGNQVDFFMTGWTSFSVDKLSAPVFKQGICMSEDQLYNIIAELKIFLFEGSASDKRTALYNSFQSLTDKYFTGQEELSRSERKNLSIEKFFTRVAGACSHSEAFNKIRLSELKDTKKIPNDQIDYIDHVIEQAVVDLKNLMTDPAARNINNESVFYWVPLELLP